jgi:hypothetical protein
MDVEVLGDANRTSEKSGNQIRSSESRTEAQRKLQRRGSDITAPNILTGHDQDHNRLDAINRMLRQKVTAMECLDGSVKIGLGKPLLVVFAFEFIVSERPRQRRGQNVPRVSPQLVASLALMCLTPTQRTA